MNPRPRKSIAERLRAFPVLALNKHFDLAIRILDYDAHAIGSGAGAAAVCFVELRAAGSDAVLGAGMHRNIVVSDRLTFRDHSLQQPTTLYLAGQTKGVRNVWASLVV